MFLAKKQGLIERLVERFKLEAYIKDRLSLSEVILLTTSIDSLLNTSKCTGVTALNLTGSGDVALYTVPSGKRANILGFWRGATTGSSDVVIHKVDGTRFFVTAASTSQSVTNSLNYQLEEGDYIGMEASGNGADGAINATCIYTEEDAY